MSEGDEGALSRWSRLKREAASARSGATAADDADVEDVEDVEAAAAPQDGDDVAPETDAEAAVLEGLPDIETLDYESDFSVFMREEVPEHLRRMALRKLWRSSPVLANVDGLNDYDWDFKKGWSLTRAVTALTPEMPEKTALPDRPETVPGRREERGRPDERTIRSARTAPAGAPSGGQPDSGVEIAGTEVEAEENQGGDSKSG